MTVTKPSPDYTLPYASHFDNQKSHVHFSSFIFVVIFPQGLSSYGSGNGTVAQTTDGMNSFQKPGMNDSFGGGHGNGMSIHQQQVLDAIMAYPDEQGISVQELRGKLKGMNDMQMR